ncbi:putative sexual development protein [Ceraceosorus guamensis]|uniref:Putative sexual development protein n=1 Tax=Ceraceosorus guamensis TaxID=1522189 RepID=A0A316W412_9BASI|nr:putative sexual development protein [Ceraceosorus guamensis]PWN44646.1 putative sexual development protein [Ceraceosorus guamensis]
MQFLSVLLAALAAAGSAAAAPSFTLSNGFPNPDPQALASIQKQAGGSLPNTPLPTELKADSIQTLQVIATNEIFEVAYFSSLLKNVTNNVEGYTDFAGQSREYVIASLKAIRAQEELHAIGANAILSSAGAKTIGACEYKFPVSDFKSAVVLANTFTDLVLGALQGASKTFAVDGGQSAEGLVSLLGSIIGQEGQQDGAYRLIQKKVPSSSPFLTAASGALAFNAVAQMFIVPDSCGPNSNVSSIGVPSFDKLSLAKGVKPSSSSTSLKFTTNTKTDLNGAHLAYISGQNKPVVVAVKNVNKQGSSTTFEASFPFEKKNFSNGLTVAALVKNNGPFADSAAVTNSTFAGPGLIVVD